MMIIGSNLIKDNASSNVKFKSIELTSATMAHAKSEMETKSNRSITKLMMAIIKKVAAKS